MKNLNAIFIALVLFASLSFAESNISIDLLTPENNSIIDIDAASFAFNVTDTNIADLACDLKIIGYGTATNTSVMSGEVVNYSIDAIPNGNLTWYVSCNDSALDSFTSGIRMLEVNVYSITTPDFPITEVTNYTYSSFNTPAIGGQSLDGIIAFFVFIGGAFLSLFYALRAFRLKLA